MPRLNMKDATETVLASPPPLADWNAGRDRAVPRPGWGKRLNNAGWPTASVMVALPREGHTSGGGEGTVTQPVTVVPASWLRELARLIEMPFSEACRYLFPEDTRPVGRPRTLPAETRVCTFRLTESERVKVNEFIRQIRGVKTAVS